MYYTLRSTNQEVKYHMKRMVRVLSAALCLLLFFSPFAEAVTFTSSGGSSAPVKKGGKTEAQVKGEQKEEVLYLDLPKEQGSRLVESLELLMLTGLQVDLSMRKLTRFEGRALSDEEVRAHLLYAGDAWKAFGKAGKRLEDAVALARIAMGRERDMEKIAESREFFRVASQLLEFFRAAPALAQSYGYGMEAADYQVRNIGIEAKKEFGALMDKLAALGRSAQSSAASAGKWVKVTLTSPAAKDSFTIAGYTISMGVSVYGLAVGVPAALALGTTAGTVLAIGGVVLFTASTVASSISVAHGLAQNRGQPGAGSLGTAATRASQVLSLVGGVTGGTKTDVLLGIISASTPEIENMIKSNPCTEDQLQAVLNLPHIRNSLDREGLIVRIQLPADWGYGHLGSGNEGGEKSGSGGGCGPCP